MDNQNDFQNLMKRARWDRLFGALIVLVLLIILMTCIFKSCGKNKEKENVTSTIAPVETQPITEAVPDNSMAVFLSPSTQGDNVYACDETITEKTAMFDLAETVKVLLEADGYTVYMCDETDNVKAKVNKGNELKCGAYVALHSNAGDDDGTGEGTECYYNPAVSGSQELAENLYNRVAELTPTDDRGIKDGCGKYYEIVNNQNPCCLLEVEFHDTTEHAQWILDNKDDLAKTIKDGIIAFLNNSNVGSMTDNAADDENSDSADDSEAE